MNSLPDAPILRKTAERLELQELPEEYYAANYYKQVAEGIETLKVLGY